MAKKMILAFVVLVAALAIPTTASAAYQRVVPSGLNDSSPTTALRDVKAIAENNEQYGNVLARQTGAATYNASDYRAVRFGKATASTTNSALNGSGSLVSTAGGVGTKTVIVQNIRTGGYVAIMIRCGNPRLKSGPLRRVKIKVIKRIYISKTFKKTAVHTCPSGQTVTITASGKVKGWLRVSARGWAAAASIYVSGKVSLAVSQKVTVACGDVPATPPPPAYDACVNIQGIQTNVPAGMIINAIGNCVTQTNNAEQRCIEQGGSYNSNTITGDVTCTIIQVNGNCSNIIVVNGSGNVISSTQEGNCNVSPPPPTCPDNRPVPPNGDCDRPPIIDVLKPAHMFANGETYAYAKAYDPDGDQMVVTIIATGAAITSTGSTVEYPSYYDGLTDTWAPCPTGWKCYRAKLFASSVENSTAYVSATVNAGGKTDTATVQTFPILPPQGF